MSHGARRLIGVLIGTMLGLTYGLVSEFANVIALPGVPLFQSPPGRALTIVLEIVGGGMLGFLAAWPAEAINGVMISALTGTSLSTLLTMILQRGDASRTMQVTALLFLTFLPRAFFFIPAAVLTLWVLARWNEETVYHPFEIKRRALSPLLAIALALAAGWFSIYSPEARTALRDLNGLIQVSLQASSASDIPEALRPVDGLWGAEHGRYTLQLIDDAEAIPVQRPMTSISDYVPAIIVRFEDGLRFGCVYIPPYTRAYCEDF
jgi:hypothetical protein